MENGSGASCDANISRFQPIPNLGVIAGLAVVKTLRTSSGLDGDLRGTNDTHLRVASSGSAETRAQG
jgi:hypothetical protein